MTNYLWPIILAVCSVFAILFGNANELSNELLNSALTAVTLFLKLLGMFCLWGGIMNIAEKSGLTQWIARALNPLLRLIFKDIRNTPKTAEAISMNITANLLGLGNAATPLGIEAMKRLSEDNSNQKIASNNMVLFVIINTAAIRLIPTTVAMLRLEHGAKQPMDILPASLITSVSAMCVGLLAAKLLERIRTC